MYLPETLNAPRMVWFGSQVYWVRAFGLEEYGIIIAWLDDVLPDREDPELPPRYGDDASQAVLKSPSGEHLLVWLALRSQGVTWNQAGAIADQATDVEKFRLGRVALSRRRTWEPSPAGGTDLGEIWCDEGWANLAMELGGIDKVGMLSLDQLEFLMSRGKVDDSHSPEAIGYARAMAMYEAAKAAEGVNGETNGDG